MSELFLRSVRFKDFRTFGKFEAEIVPAPGLTLLVGTNGLGKSNFFDAVEWGLTGEVRRFKSYMGATDQGKYLTRRGAALGDHAVRLGFSDDSAISRGPRENPPAEDAVALLKKAAWTAQIQDIGTYLAFTHFLGQAAQQRFTSRDRGEQWESLKGPSGIDRLDEVRNGLRGRATELAFNRRVRRETEAVAEVERQLTEWQGWRVRLARLREAADADGALPADAFGRRLDALAAAVARLARDVRDDPTAASGDRLAAVRAALETLRRDNAPRRARLEALADLPARYAAEAAVADPETPILVEARAAATREADALAAAVSATAIAREGLDAAAADVAARDAALTGLETARADLDVAARAQADATRFGAERQRLDAELARRRAELQALENELAEIQQRASTLAGLAVAAQAAAEIAELAGKLPDLQSRAAASATAQTDADANASAARARLPDLTADRNRLTSDLEGSRAALEAARERASAVAAAVAAIASHLHDDDLDCPVCRSHFEPGGLRLVAGEAAAAQGAALAAAEVQHADLTRQLEAAVQGIAAAEAVLRTAEQARATAATDAAAVADLQGRLAAALPDAVGDLVVTAVEADRRAAATLAGAQAARAVDEARRAAASAGRDDLRVGLPQLEAEVLALDEQIAAREAARRSAVERLAAAGLSDADTATLDLRLAEVRTARAAAEATRLDREEAVRVALQAEAETRSRQEIADSALRRLITARDAATAALAALETRWRDAGLAGSPSMAALEAALSAVGEALRDIERLEDERAVLVAAYEVTLRDQDLRDLATDMARVGGEGAADDPERHEADLIARREAAQTALRFTESAHAAVGAFADKLRDEASKFSTQFLTPLNGLIDDFNEALLSTPGETVRLNAAYFKDRTQFDMGLHYRDPLDDALYDTGLPPQVVLSEGQLAANGFSILCAASTAYPWSRWRALLLDDPLQHNDIIHVAAFVDLMRNLVELQRYQLVMSSHDRGEGEFIKRKFDAAGLPCSVIGLTAPSKAGVRYLPPEHNAAARDVLAGALARTA